MGVPVVSFIASTIGLQAAITLAWGILAGAAANINQYWTTLCGWLIARMGIYNVVLGGMAMIVMSFLFVMMRVLQGRGRKVSVSSVS